MALELSKYLSKETKAMVVQQGFSELVPLYKLMEKRDMFDFVNQMKVGKGAVRDSFFCKLYCGYKQTSYHT